MQGQIEHRCVCSEMSFQPWKQVLPNQFYRNKGDGSEMSSTFGKMKNGDVEISPAGQSTSNLTILPHPFELPSGEYPSPSQYESEQHPKQHSPQQPHHNGTKFSIFSQLLNLNKINAFDNLLLNASLTLDDDDLNGDKRQGMRKLMEQAIRCDIFWGKILETRGGHFLLKLHECPILYLVCISSCIFLC